jgi:hypothetical protein
MALAETALTAGRVVFFARQRAFQAAAMDLGAEARLDGSKALSRCQFGAGGLEIDNERDDLGGDLVSALRPARLRQQAGEPGRGKGILSLVEGRPRHAKARGNVADRDAVGLMSPHHLVTYLNEIPRVEERVVGKQRIADRLGMRIEGAVARQRLALEVLTRRSGHAGSPTRNVK